MVDGAGACLGGLLELAEGAVGAVSAAGLLFLFGRADGFVDAAFDSSSLEDEAFDAGEEVETIKDGVEPVGDGAVAAVLGVGVVGGVAARALNDFGFLKEGNHFTVFARRSVGPAVDFIGDGA